MCLFGHEGCRTLPEQLFSYACARIRTLVEIMKEGGSLLPSMLAQRIQVSKANMKALDERELNQLLSLLQKLKRG
ncbi:hypothetical protein AN963_00910 [Brevibacillus choshinensis]|uniref:Transcriptional regulator n=1 Tax=Brevibacillus choshinensis TaxID=54911 RepID=A0ABR5NA45_BRECH|nr:hypothetical protein AN963_00910 [Brevibacillus choshinensis]